MLPDSDKSLVESNNMSQDQRQGSIWNINKSSIMKIKIILYLYIQTLKHTQPTTIVVQCYRGGGGLKYTLSIRRSKLTFETY